MATPKVLNNVRRPDSTGDNEYNLAGTLTCSGVVDLSDADYTAPASGDIVKSVLSVVTLAELNAGKVLVPEVVGKTITPLDIKMTVSGAFITGTSADLEDTNGTPVSVASVAVAGLTDGAVINEAEANTTLGAGYLAPLTLGKGLRMIKKGTDFAGGTSITVRVLYKVV